MPGDVILGFDGKPVQTSADMARMAGSTKPGTTVALDVWRKGEKKQVKVAVEELPPDRAPASAQTEPERAAPNRAGMVLGELTPQQRSRLKLDSGLLVRRATGPAQRAGIQSGDLVLAINDVPAKSVVEFEAELAKNAGKTVALLIRRGQETLYVPLKTG
jgi:serine protease Do